MIFSLTKWKQEINITSNTVTNVNYEISDTDILKDINHQEKQKWY